MARQDWGSVDRHLTELNRIGWAGGSQTIGAAFALAVNRRFGSSDDLRGVASFVADTRKRYQEGEQFSALAMEGMIRAALGEPDLIDDIDAETAFSMQIAVLGTLLQDRQWTEVELEEFIREVEETAAQYM
ncbi:hypothetical protein O7621_03700 [Solwaraspora sp. WMMD937]|uniref:hypothetical protein n=1 Tax=Solwaraspora sp. WMMD937 TaxID=3016090 RepID=UPI00249A25DE|nr:hypothetical protein [Solwaraspora sp. WMMD937]WFE22464.1 hypothetical protein O7621_03700 [Solwaraspora sp. WMMD937]